MSHKLGKESGVLSEKNDILEAEIPSVLRSGEVVVTGEGAGILEVSEEFTVEGDFFFNVQRFFVQLWPVDENLLGG